MARGRWRVLLRKAERLAADALPVGIFELHRRPAREYADIDYWPSLSRIVIQPGARVRFDPGSK